MAQLRDPIPVSPAWLGDVGALLSFLAECEGCDCDGVTRCASCEAAALLGRAPTEILVLIEERDWRSGLRGETVSTDGAQLVEGVGGGVL